MSAVRRIVLIIAIISLISCSGQKNKRAQGYVEGRYTYMASSVPGVLQQLTVQRGTQVKKGDLLFVLEEQPESDIYQAAVQNLQQAKAARDAIAANITYAKLTYERYKILVPKNAIQQSQLDSAKSQYDALLAQLAQADATIASNAATVAQTNWTKNQKKIYAPSDSLVFDTYYRLGEYTTANNAILSLLAPEDIKVIFYVPEQILGGLKLGKKVQVHLDGARKDFIGTINFIAPNAEYTPPVIFSDQTTYKLIYRIEAEFSPIDAVQLHPGQPVMVDYNYHD